MDQHFDSYSYHLIGSSSVPWVEALSGANFSADLVDTLATQRDYVIPTSGAVTTVAAFQPGRGSQLSSYWGASNGLPLPPPWDTYTYNSPDVMTAFKQYVDRAIALLGGASTIDYVVLGFEVDGIIRAGVDRWLEYCELYIETYTYLKVTGAVGFLCPLGLALLSVDIFISTCCRVSTHARSAIQFCLCLRAGAVADHCVWLQY